MISVESVYLTLLFWDRLKLLTDLGPTALC
mgnify:FL=1